MKAVIIDQTAKAQIAFKDLPEPNPLPNQVIVDVKALSLNRGEVKHLPLVMPAGSPVGWDISGIVSKQADDGTGPKLGERVVGFLPRGGWAEKVAVLTENVAVIPDNVTFEQASTLPVAGLTAYHALLQGGLLLGKRVLITGGTGGVGHFGIQLAAKSGADVYAPVRREEQIKIVSEAGASHSFVSDDLSNSDDIGGFDLIVDGVGGTLLQNCFKHLNAAGTIVNYGVSASPEITINTGGFFSTGRCKFYGLSLFSELGYESAAIGLERLAKLIGSGHITPLIDNVRPWEQIEQAALDLIDRKYFGKIVLTV